MASIISAEETTLAVMDANTLRSIMNDDAQKSLQQKYQFFKDLFQISFTKEEMYKIIANFYEINVANGKVI